MKSGIKHALWIIILKCTDVQINRKKKKEKRKKNLEKRNMKILRENGSMKMRIKKNMDGKKNK